MGEHFPLWTISQWSIKFTLRRSICMEPLDLEEHMPRRPAVKHVNMQLIFLCCHHVILNGINEKK